MIRFLHTADWQMGMRAAKFGEAGKRVREERLTAGRRVVQAARENGVDFVLVAGDVFEDNAVERALAQQVADILATAPCPIYVIPGNHDPLVPGSVWEHRSWQAAKNVVILKGNLQTAQTGVCYVRGYSIGKEVLEAGTYKKVNSSEKTKAKNTLRKALKNTRIRSGR